MTSTSPPPEAQRFGRSQTPESPRPVHIPEPANIPVLLNQMDPVFNDTATYNIPHNQTFSPFPDPTSEPGAQSSGVDEHDAVQNFFREAEHQAAIEPEPSVKTVQNALQVAPAVSTEASVFPSIPSYQDSYNQQQQDSSALADQTLATTLSTAIHDESMNLETNPSTSEKQEKENAPATEDTLTKTQQPEHQNLGASTEHENGVDYQSLLDTISQSASTAPAANGLTAPTTAASGIEDISRPLPSIPGLPPKPPPQEHPIDFPSYSSYDNPTTQHLNVTNAAISGDNAKESSIGTQPVGIPEQANAQNTIPPIYPPLPSFNAFGQLSASNPPQLPIVHDQMAPGQDVNRSQDPTERPWSPRTQARYDQFLEDERRYVTEGIWDKFPVGSRLFVGNLPSEKVTKRDLFHKFHKHGQLAQISIKQAYGFVQFLEAASCLAALNAEQGVEIRGRKVHLEVSKPQSNTRNARGGGGSNKNQSRRRSRSPDRAGRRDNRNYSDFRDEPGRRREEFRNRRSPSPRGYRQRDDYHSGGRETRSRSPFYGTGFAQSPSTTLDDETLLQLPRRDPRQVPDVQLLVLEPEVVQSFINWVEQGFRNKGLQASTIWVNNRLPLPALIKRQIIEGVQAVVKLTRSAQNNSKIPLQVFDRSAGASNVNFSEYVDLDVSVAADVVNSARQKERGGHAAQAFRSPTFPTPSYQQPIQYGAPQPSIPYPPQNPPQYPPQHGQTPQFAYPSSQQNPYRPPTQPPTPTGQPANLQQLLANLRQPANPSATQNVVGQASNGQPANLSNFLNNASAAQPYPGGQVPVYGQYTSGSPPQGGQQSNVQNIMEQLARYQR